MLKFVLPFLILANAFSNEIITTKYKGFNISFPRNENIRITQITDGDTIKGITESGEEHEFRFHCIDTPESVMPLKKHKRTKVAQWRKYWEESNQLS